MSKEALFFKALHKKCEVSFCYILKFYYYSINCLSSPHNPTRRHVPIKDPVV